MAGKSKVAMRGGWSGEMLLPLVAAAMAGKLLDFEEMKLRDAMGIAYAQCAGNNQAHLDGASTVRLQQAFGSKAGILSTVLADEGFTGAKAILEGSYGLYPLYMYGEYAVDVLTEELGKQFEGSEITIKAYPCCGFTHAGINAALQLTQEHEIKADDIEKITLHTSSYGHSVCGGEKKIVPKTVPDAQFSYYYAVATSLVRGKVFIDDFTEDAVRDPRVLAMARKIEVVMDTKKDDKRTLGTDIDMEIETKDGENYRKSMGLENPISMVECAQKLQACARFSAKPLPNETIDKISQLVERFDELEDVTLVLQYLT
jgi:2-methylcitrate dehydratase PrpD